jgi:hypothetical protein
MNSFTVDDFIENDDGSATVTVTMDYDTLLIFARKGFLTALRESAEHVLEENVPNDRTGTE